MKPETQFQLFAFVRTLAWALVTVSGPYWIGKPLAEGLGHWMTLASPDKFLDALFSYPIAIVVVVVLIGPGRVRSYFETLLQRGFEGFGFKVPPPTATAAPSPPVREEPPIQPAGPLTQAVESKSPGAEDHNK